MSYLPFSFLRWWIISKEIVFFTKFLYPSLILCVLIGLFLIEMTVEECAFDFLICCLEWPPPPFLLLLMSILLVAVVTLHSLDTIASHSSSCCAIGYHCNLIFNATAIS